MGMTPDQAQAVRLREQGLSNAQIGADMGITKEAARCLIKRAKKWAGAPEGVQNAVRNVGIDNMAIVSGGWLKTKEASIQFRLPRQEAEPPEDIAERIADRINRIQPAPEVHRRLPTSSQFRNFIPLFDVHLSMRVGSYGTAACVDRLREGTEEIVGRMPAAECTIILNGGDFTEQNDPSNQTPKNRHPLSVDGEYDDITDIAADVTIEIIEAARRKSDKVIYKALRGNHDPNTARILRAGLRQRFRDDPSVEIDVEGIDFFAHAWEGNMIAGLHGDVAIKPKDIVLAFAARYPALWFQSWFRELFYGHRHHSQVAEFPGMLATQLRAVAPMGIHARENLYTSLSEMLAITYQKGGGRWGTWPHTFKDAA